MTAKNAPRIRRTFTVQQRSDMLRERVRDACHHLGHGDFDYGIHQFARRCVLVGEARGMRVWADRSVASYEVGVYSIKNLIQYGKGHHGTGRNVHWVLDLFEAALDDIYRGTPPSRRPPDPMVEAVEDEVGVQVEATPAAETDSTLTERLMAAWILRDENRAAAEDQFLECLLEVGRAVRADR